VTPASLARAAGPRQPSGAIRTRPHWPNNRKYVVEGGHLINPADPVVLSFLQELLASDSLLTPRPVRQIQELALGYGILPGGLG
jgi:hypothetical protein